MIPYAFRSIIQFHTYLQCFGGHFQNMFTFTMKFNYFSICNHIYNEIQLFFKEEEEEEEEEVETRGLLSEARCENKWSNLVPTRKFNTARMTFI